MAGDVIGIDAFTPAIQAKGGKVIPLNVSAPFHCSLMKPAADKLAKDLDAINLNNVQFSVYSNVTAKEISSPEEAKDLLKRQVCSSVRWTESMLNSIKEKQLTHSVEFGSGGVLTKLLKRISPEVNRLEASDFALANEMAKKLNQI